MSKLVLRTPYASRLLPAEILRGSGFFPRHSVILLRFFVLFHMAPVPQDLHSNHWRRQRRAIPPRLWDPDVNYPF